MSNKLSLIISREFNIRVRKRSFIVTTFLVPVLLVFFLGFTMYMSMMNLSVERIAIVDHSGQDYDTLFHNSEYYTFVKSNHDVNYYKKMGKDNKEGITAVLEIRENLLTNPKAISIYSYKELPTRVTDMIANRLEQHLFKENIEKLGIPNILNMVEHAKVHINLNSESYKWDNKGEEQRSSGMFAGMIGMGLALLSFMFISTFGSLVMAGVMEEKKNRIVEVLVSSVKPFTLMCGKIIGIGLVGLFQLLLWGVLITIIYIGFSFFAFGGMYNLEQVSQMNNAALSSGFMGGMDSSSLMQMKSMAAALAGINFFNLIFMFVLYFIGGYFMYASLFAAVGAATTNEEDSNQFIMPVMLLLMFAFYTGVGSMDNPEGPMALWCSFIPFTSPVVMMIRIPYDVALWQQLLSLVILYASVALLIWITAKIYRIGILMYGKKPSFKDLCKWITFK